MMGQEESKANLGLTYASPERAQQLRDGQDQSKPTVDSATMDLIKQKFLEQLEIEKDDPRLKALDLAIERDFDVTVSGFKELKEIDVVLKSIISGAEFQWMNFGPDSFKFVGASEERQMTKYSCLVCEGLAYAPQRDNTFKCSNCNRMLCVPCGDKITLKE